MFQKKIGLLMLMLSTGYLLPVASIAQTRPEKPNIIFILTDDLGYGDIGVFYQNQRKKTNDPSLPYELTPNIDQMAGHGAMFTQQYSNAPVCAPSRASLLTGVHQGNAHVRDNQFDKALEDNHNIATVLKQAGYATVAIGKWGLQGVKEEAPYWPAHPLKRGFDHFFGYMRHRDGHEHYPVEGIYRGSKEVWKDYENVVSGMDKCYTTDLWTAYAKQWIIEETKNKKGQPFFMYLAFDAPHAVLELPTQAYPAGSGLHGGLQWIGDSSHMINTASGKPDAYVYPEYANATYDDDRNSATPMVPWPDTYKRYATATRRIDDATGDVIQLLKDLKIDSNTIVIFTSDNGPSIESYLPKEYVPNHPTFFASYGPFDGIKRDCWEGGLRMPTIAWWPGKINEGKIINTPSMLSDWLPTFAGAAHIPAPARVNGVSLLPSLTGNGKQKTSMVYVEYFENGNTPDFKEFNPSHRGRQRNQMQMVRMDSLVGVRYDIKSADDDFEIYNVVTDPDESDNLGRIPAYQYLQNAMKAKVLQVRRASQEAPRPYDSALIPAVPFQKKMKHGWNWKFFEGDFPWVIEPDALQPKSSGDAGNPDGEFIPGKRGMMLYTGFLDVPSDGEYDFSFRTRGRAFIRLHDAELFDADHNYLPGRTLTASVFLQKGLHPITIYSLPTNNLNNPDPSAISANHKSPVEFKWKKTGEPHWKVIEKNDVYRIDKQ